MSDTTNADDLGHYMRRTAELKATNKRLWGEVDRLQADNARLARLAVQEEDETERLRDAIRDALGRHQVTHIHAALRRALDGEGDADAG